MAGDDIADGHAETGERGIFTVVDLGFVRGITAQCATQESGSGSFGTH